MRVLFAVLSWGLGHATRDLPLINRMIKEGHEVTIATSGRSMDLLRAELEDACDYVTFKDYPLPYPKHNYFMLKASVVLPNIITSIVKEHRRVERFLRQNKFERIITDNRFGFYHRRIPSFFISHQLRFIMPGRIKGLELLSESFNYQFHNKFKRFIVPDYSENSLSGDLSHNLKFFKKKQIAYIGILSSIKKRKLREYLDVFISISGPEPQRTVFEKRIFKQIRELEGKVAVALGKPESSSNSYALNEKVQVHDYLNRNRQEEILNRSKLVVSRSGYTSLMELVELGKKAFFVPTPGQTEQEYLSKYHKEKGTFYSNSQSRFNLARDIETAKQYPGVSLNNATKKAVENFMNVVFS